MNANDRKYEVWESTNQAPMLLVVAMFAVAGWALSVALGPASEGNQAAIDLLLTLLVGWPFLAVYVGRVYRTRGLLVVAGVAWIVVINSMQPMPALMSQLWGYPLIGIVAGVVALVTAMFL